MFVSSGIQANKKGSKFAPSRSQSCSTARLQATPPTPTRRSLQQPPLCQLLHGFHPPSPSSPFVCCCSAPPLAHTNPFMATQGKAAPCKREGLSSSASVPAPGAPPATAQQEQGAITWPSLCNNLPQALSQLQAWCKRSANTAVKGKGDDE